MGGKTLSRQAINPESCREGDGEKEESYAFLRSKKASMFSCWQQLPWGGDGVESGGVGVSAEKEGECPESQSKHSQDFGHYPKKK